MLTHYCKWQKSYWVNDSLNAFIDINDKDVKFQINFANPDLNLMTVDRKLKNSINNNIPDDIP